MQSPRYYYGDKDLVPCFQVIQTHLKKNLTQAIRMALEDYKSYSLNTIRNYYKQWINQGQPPSFVIQDQRQFNSKLKAVSLDDELVIVQKIKDMGLQNQQVSYNTVHLLAKTQSKNTKFKASKGWIFNFIHRHGLSSQAISSRFSATDLKTIQNDLKLVEDYKQSYRDFVQTHGDQHVYNLDQTSFGMGSNMRTITSKNSKNQPKIKNVYKGSGLSIGCIITPGGRRLRPHLIAKGKTPRCLKKYGIYQDHPDCVLGYSPNGWFEEPSVLEMIECVGHDSQKQPCLLILDSLRAHWTVAVRARAQELNITLLQVPPGQTSKYQPLDYNFNGAFKMKIQAHWFGHHFNEDKANLHINSCQTIIESYNSVSKEVIQSSFKCLD